MLNPDNLQGLSSTEAKNRLQQYGPNQIEQKKQSLGKKILVWTISPVSLMLLGAALLSLYDKKIFDLYFIIVLYFINLVVGFWHEWKADNAISSLEKHLTLVIRTLRDKTWKRLDSRLLVPGDIIELTSGNIVPADGEVLAANNAEADESVLTGESFPLAKQLHDKVFRGSFVTTGKLLVRVDKTGKNTEFGKTLQLVEKSRKKSLMEKDILLISKFLSGISLLVVVILTIMFLVQKNPLSEIITLDLSLLIAGVPVALPTIMSLIMGLGVTSLTKKNVVTRRLSSLEDLANVNLLLSDKTGTLTSNNIQIKSILPYAGYSQTQVLALALTASPEEDHNVINHAIQTKAQTLGLKAFASENYIPADSERKRSTAVAIQAGQKTLVSVGAPQIIAQLCSLNAEGVKKFEQDVEDAATQGYRTLAVAINPAGAEEKNMAIAGLLLLADAVRQDAGITVAYLQDNGVEVKMVTGDHHAIARRVAAELAIKKPILSREEFLRIKPGNHTYILEGYGGLAEALPQDKLQAVKAAKNFYTVAVTGDGVNDLPAIKTADVGIAVKNAVDVLRSSADIVLLTQGIGVIKDAIFEARKIFSRIYHYSVYRISESFRVIITIAVLGFIYHDYPLTPIHLLMLALLNDVPIISLAYDRVKVPARPSHINVKARFKQSLLYGITGVFNSLIIFFIFTYWLHSDWQTIQTIFFLKLVVSGHMLIYVAHTSGRWWKNWPSWQVILSTSLTQVLATCMAIGGVFTQAIPLKFALFVWIWSFFWMQISELTKLFLKHSTDN